MTNESHKCPMDGTELKNMGHLAETVFRPCAKCGREWYYVSEDMMRKTRKVSIVASIEPGKRLDDCIKPVKES